MRPAAQTRLLLIVVLVSTVVSTAAWNWPGSWGVIATSGCALIAGMAAGRIARLIREATE